MSAYAAYFAETHAGQTLAAVGSFFDHDSTELELRRVLDRLERDGSDTHNA